MKITSVIVTTLVLALPGIVFSDPTIRLAALEFGTVNWELQTIKNYELDKKYGFKFNVRPVANPQAGKIALQSDAVDMIVSDWIWVSRQRHTGSDFTFIPYSNTAGALMLPAVSKIRTLSDLVGKRVGIAGGELDKNWLLLRALTQHKLQLDLDNKIEKVYAAPPLLNQQIILGNLDAIITYWHYAAHLEALGYRSFITGQEFIKQLGIDEILPTLGYVFRQSWAATNPGAVKALLKASIEAKNLLCDSDPAWTQIKTLLRTDNTDTQGILRTRYCAGRIKKWGAPEKHAAAAVYSILRRMTGDKLTGKSIDLQAGTFWPYSIGY